MRKQMKAKLDDLKTPGNWDHIVEQIGMFSYTGLTEGQVKHMTEKFHVHMMKNGRMAMVGLNSKNVDYVAEAIHDATINAK